jgi:putative flippase GtrA
MSATALQRPRIPTVVTQLVRFGLVGATNTALTLAVYSALVALVSAPVALAAAVGWAVGAVNGFVLNRAWTFRASARGALSAARYAVVALVGSALNAALVSVAVSVYHLPHFAGELAVLPPVTVLSFLLCRGWVFAPGEPA